MQINIQLVALDLSPRQKRIIRHGVVAGAVIAALGVGMALAAPIDTTWIGPNKPVTSTDLKGDLDGLQAQISSGRAVVMINGKSMSVGATVYKANTTSTYTGAQVGGYAGGKALCETAVSSPSAHMCTPQEVLRSAAVGITPPPTPGWLSTGIISDVATNPASTLNDCTGFTSAAQSSSGQVVGNSWAPSEVRCVFAQQVLCCD